VGSLPARQFPAESSGKQRLSALFPVRIRQILPEIRFGGRVPGAPLRENASPFPLLKPQRNAVFFAAVAQLEVFHLLFFHREAEQAGDGLFGLLARQHFGVEGFL